MTNKTSLDVDVCVYLIHPLCLRSHHPPPVVALRRTTHTNTVSLSLDYARFGGGDVRLQIFTETKQVG